MIRFVILTGLLVVSGMAVSCGGPEEAADRLYGSDEFTVYADSIVQGAVCVKAVSPVRMIATGPHMASDTLSVDIDSVRPVCLGMSRSSALWIFCITKPRLRY